MNEKTCENCKHFRIHYVRISKGYGKTRSGHCVYPKSKLRYKDTKACEYWKQIDTP